MGIFGLGALAGFGRAGQILMQLVHQLFDEVGLLLELVRFLFRQYVEVLFAGDMDDFDKLILAFYGAFDDSGALVLCVFGRRQSFGRSGRQLQRPAGPDVVGVSNDRVQCPQICHGAFVRGGNAAKSVAALNGVGVAHCSSSL